MKVGLVCVVMVAMQEFQTPNRPYLVVVEKSNRVSETHKECLPLLLRLVNRQTLQLHCQDYLERDKSLFGHRSIRLVLTH